MNTRFTRTALVVGLAAGATLGACWGDDDHSDLFNESEGAPGEAGSGGGDDSCANLSAWMGGKDYKTGDQVGALCESPGGGQTMCTVGVRYLFTCNNGAQCGVYAPGADGWWGAWSVAMACAH